MSDYEAVKEMLVRIDAEIAHLVAQREDRIKRTVGYWSGKRRTLLASELERIEIDKHYAQYTLEVGHLRAERAQIIDALAQAEMTKMPPPIVFRTE